MRLQYGSFVFASQNVKTLEFTQTPKFTEDNVEYVWDEYKIRVKALFNRNAPTGQPSGEAAGQAPEYTYTQNMGCLSKPRQTLIFNETFEEPLEGTSIIFSPATGSSTDANNGPTPGQLKVTELSPVTYMVEWDVTTWVYNCCGGNAAQNKPITAHRYYDTVSYDEDFLSTFTRTGRMYFRADFVGTQAQNQNPAGGQMRQSADDDAYGARTQILAQCPMHPNCLRKSEYTVAENGLGLDYKITDREVYSIPRANLTGYTAAYTCSTDKGAIINEQMQITVKGSRTTAKADLYVAASQILTSRINPLGANGSTTINSAWTENLDKNEMTLRVSTFAPRIASDANNNNPNQSFMGQVLFGNHNLTFAALDPPNGGLADANGIHFPWAAQGQEPNPGKRGTAPGWDSPAGYVLQVNPFNDPCLQSALVLTGLSTPDNSRVPYVNSTQPAVITSVPVLPQLTTVYQGVPVNYTLHNIWTDYRWEYNTAQLPTTAAAASICTLAMPTMKKYVTWTLESTGGQPSMPSEFSSDANEVLCSVNKQPAAVEAEADGATQCWRIKGQYVYWIKDPSAVGLYAGTYPFLTTTYTGSYIGPSQFVSGLTSPATLVLTSPGP